MRLIDADALDDVMLILNFGQNRGITRAEYKLIESVLFEFPTIDAVPVIRCKDCKYYQHGKNADDWLWCMMNHHYTDEEKYCAWAERKEE